MFHPFGHFLMLSVLCLSLLLSVWSLPQYPARIPNGDNVKVNGNSWPAVGHSTEFGGSINQFARDFSAQGHIWNQALCRLDSDGDGQTNGHELGDPNCEWTKDKPTPLATEDISHPGICNSTTSRVTIASGGGSSLSSGSGAPTPTPGSGCGGSAPVPAPGSLPPLFIEYDSLLAQYDYVVVGGGAAGCVAAFTLAEQNPTKQVLLIEGGEREEIDFYESRNAARSEFNIKHNGRVISRLLGGGSTWNGRQYRGVPRWYVKAHNMFDDTADEILFDEAAVWAEDRFAAPRLWPQMQANLSEEITTKFGFDIPSTNPTSFEEVAGFGARSYRGASGDVSARDAPGFVYLGTRALLEDNRRTSGHYLIENYVGDNLKILLSTFVKKIVLEGARVTTLKTESGNVARDIALAPGGEIVLCANVYETPSLLQRSGIGPASVLQKLGVTATVSGEALVQAEHVGKGYWNSIYLNRYFIGKFDWFIDWGTDIMANTPSSSSSSISLEDLNRLILGADERLHHMIRKRMYGKDIRLRVDLPIRDGRPDGLGLDLECTSDMPRGKVEASTENYKPDGTMPFDEDKDEFARVTVDCSQAYFLDHWWPIFRASTGKSYTEAVDSFFLLAGVDSLVQQIKDHGEPSTTAEYTGPRWSDDATLRNAFRDEWASNIAKNVEVDSIHYGGTCALGKCVGKSNFTVFGTTNLRVADLSLYENPLPGNTMAPAYTIARYVAKNIISKKPATLTSYGDFSARYESMQANLTHIRFRSELQSGFAMLYNTDGSNLRNDFLYHKHLFEQPFYHDYDDEALCGEVANVNQSITTVAEYTTDFTLDFHVKADSSADGGMHVGSHIKNDATSGTKLTGPRIETGSDDFGAISDGQGGYISAPSADAASSWKEGEYNRVQLQVTGSQYTVTVNGQTTESVQVSPKGSDSEVKDRIGMSVKPAVFGATAGRACFRHVMIKGGKSGASSSADLVANLETTSLGIQRGREYLKRTGNSAFLGASMMQTAMGDDETSSCRTEPNGIATTCDALPSE